MEQTQADLSQALYERVKTHPVVFEKRYYKILEAVDYSGQSRSVLYEAHKRGDLVFTKFGTATRIEKGDLDDYLDRIGVKIAE